MHIYPLTRRVAGRVAALLLCALIVASGPGGSAPAQAAPAPAPTAAGAVSVRWGFYVTYNPNSLVRCKPTPAS